VGGITGGEAGPQVLVLVGVAAVDGEDVPAGAEELVGGIDADVLIVVGRARVVVRMELGRQPEQADRIGVSPLVLEPREAPVRGRPGEVAGVGATSEAR